MDENFVTITRRDGTSLREFERKWTLPKHTTGYWKPAPWRSISSDTPVIPYVHGYHAYDPGHLGLHVPDLDVAFWILEYKGFFMPLPDGVYVGSKARLLRPYYPPRWFAELKDFYDEVFHLISRYQMGRIPTDDAFQLPSHWELLESYEDARWFYQTEQSAFEYVHKKVHDGLAAIAHQMRRIHVFYKLVNDCFGAFTLWYPLAGWVAGRLIDDISLVARFTLLQDLPIPDGYDQYIKDVWGAWRHGYGVLGSYHSKFFVFRLDALNDGGSNA